MSMSTRASFSDDSKTINKALPKALLLRDYLLDDMSSCSSNGFRSYPRRRCCTTVRFLVEMDLNRNSKLNLKQQPRSIVESKMNLKQKQSSVLQRASAVMITAFKRFPFAGGTGCSRKASFFPKSISRKLLRHGLWKKADNHNVEVKRLKSFGDLIKEEEITKPPSSSQFSTAVTTIPTTPELTSSDNNSWSGSEFTATSNTSEVIFSQNDFAYVLPENEKTTDGKEVGATTATVTTTNSSDTTENAKWQDKHDEQSSPVSVMDFPSDNDNDFDDEDAVSSAFQNKHLDVEGIRKVMHKTRRFDGLPELEPVKLEDRIAQSILESPSMIYVDLDQEENRIKKKAMALLRLMKSTISSHCVLKYEAAESLLLGFFKEQIVEENVPDHEMLQAAKHWMVGQVQEIFLDWESQNTRQIYLKGMENEVQWSKYDYEVEKENVCMEVECEIYNSLINDVLLDFQL